jgi:sugar phosphate isomerase/epimerase
LQKHLTARTRKWCLRRWLALDSRPFNTTWRVPALPPCLAHEVARAARFQDIGIAAVSGTYNMIHPDKAVRATGLARLEVLAARCHDMGTHLITLCTGTRDPLDQWRHHPDNASTDAWRDLLEAMEAALAIADRHGIVLGIEPELANTVSSAEKARQLIGELANPRIKIVLDAANLFEQVTLAEQRRVVATAVEMLGGHIAMAHTKDRAGDGRFVAAGKGVLDYGHYLSCLQAAGFDGPLVTHGLMAQDAEGVSKFLRGALISAGAEVR